ncbi:hypothetical protein [Bifidobacterium catenulatum]|uniref:hypothetical protein n=1 Tax=Bifidobacterium catenulatum TaxID=1686 RepID=UPI0032C14C24
MLDTITPANIAHGVRIALNHTVIASAPLMRTQYALNRAAEYDDRKTGGIAAENQSSQYGCCAAAPSP